MLSFTAGAKVYSVVFCTMDQTNQYKIHGGQKWQQKPQFPPVYQILKTMNCYKG